MLFQIWVKKQSSGDWRPGFWSCVVVMTTVSWTASSSTNPGLFFSSSPLHFLSPSHPWQSQVKKKRASRLHGPIQLLWWWYESKGDCVCWFLKQRGGLCLQLRISETENLWIHPVITIWRIYFFFIKHMHMPLCWVGFLSFFHGQCCVSVDRETPNSLHTSTLELRFLWRRWPRFKYITLLIGSFLVALYLVGNSFLFLMYT